MFGSVTPVLHTIRGGKIFFEIFFLPPTIYGMVLVD